MENTRKRGFKIPEGRALEIIEEISSKSYRNYTDTLQYLVLKGYQLHCREEKLISGGEDGQLNERRTNVTEGGKDENSSM